MELRHHTALITGGTAGIGLEAVAAIGPTARFIQADMSDADSVRALVKRCGDVDIVVNNAASFPASSTVDQDPAVFETVFDTNVRGAYFLVAALVPGMVQRGRGSIVNVTTMVASKFLASPRASFVTGSTLHVDGGGSAV